MNGEAITKRYEVKDLETGEVLDEPLYVLRPLSDELASTAMFAYSYLCYMDHPLNRIVAQPGKDKEAWRVMLDEVIAPYIKPSEMSESFADPLHLADVGAGADGTALYIKRLLQSFGLYPGLLVARDLQNESTKEAAEEWLHMKDLLGQDEYIVEQVEQRHARTFEAEEGNQKSSFYETEEQRQSREAQLGHGPAPVNDITG